MEIPPASSFSQVSALFNDLSANERQKELLGLSPFETPNVHVQSSNIRQASSHTGIDVEFRTQDNHEGHRILNGPLLYPFQEKAQIFNHKFDPFYYDGSELDDSFNVQENLIGTPLGASSLEDPRLSYVKNMLHMKELHGANDPLADDYLKNLYMTNVEKGSNYYQNQLDKLDASMSLYSRAGRYKKHKPLEVIQFTQNIATGNAIHEKHTARREYKSPTDAGMIQNSSRTKRMARLANAVAPYSIVPHNPLHRNRIGARNMIQQGTDLQAVFQRQYNAIPLPDTENADVEPIDAEEELPDDTASFLPYLPRVDEIMPPITPQGEHSASLSESGEEETKIPWYLRDTSKDPTFMDQVKNYRPGVELDPHPADDRYNFLFPNDTHFSHYEGVEEFANRTQMWHEDRPPIYKRQALGNPLADPTTTPARERTTRRPSEKSPYQPLPRDVSQMTSTPSPLIRDTASSGSRTMPQSYSMSRERNVTESPARATPFNLNQTDEFQSTKIVDASSDRKDQMKLVREAKYFAPSTVSSRMNIYDSESKTTRKLIGSLPAKDWFTMRAEAFKGTLAGL